MNTVKLSKYLSLILRHDPGSIGVVLDDEGWVAIDTLLERMAAQGRPVTRAQMDEVVRTNDKQRFAYNEAGTHVRASQGHSIKIDLELQPVEPPAVLYHGTATRFLPSIMQEGLTSQSRQHVHLSPDTQTAAKVGVRHGKLAILEVDSEGMAAAGHRFYRSANGVWLTDSVPVAFLSERPIE